MLSFEGSVHQQKEKNSTQQYKPRIAHCHVQVTKALQATQARAKARHDKH